MLRGKFCVDVLRPATNLLLRNSFTAQANSNQSIDQNEVDYFKKQTELWWDEMGQFKPLHAMNKLRVTFIRDGLINSGTVKQEYLDTPYPFRTLNILEVGCGGGILTEALARLGGNLTGIDATKEMIDLATNHAMKDRRLSNLQYKNESIEDHANSNFEHYDAVVASEVIEHVQEKDFFLESCVKCLKPGGSIFVTTLNKTILSRIAAIFVAEDVLNIVPKGTHDWDKFISPHGVQRYLESYKCRTKVVHGLCYNFLNNQWYWIPDTSLSYALHAVKNKEAIASINSK